MKPRNGTKAEYIRAAEAAQRLTHDDAWFGFFLPYKFVPIPNERFKYVFMPINRNHKPVGMLTNECVRYEDHIGMAIVFDSDPAKFNGVWWNVEHLTLYGDGVESRFDYFERLDRLCQKRLRVHALMIPAAHDQRMYAGRHRIVSPQDSK